MDQKVTITIQDINNLRKKVQSKRDEINQAKGNRDQLLHELENQKRTLKDQFGISPEEIESTLEKLKLEARESYIKAENIVSEWGN